MQSELRAGWRPLLAAMVATGIAFPAVAFYSIGIFAPIFSREFGWTFASIFAGLGFVPIVVLLGGPVVGHLVDRHGPRLIAAISFAALGIGYISLAFSNGSLVMYYASWIAMAIGGLGATPISLTRAVTGTFVRQRGLALGVAMSGVGLYVFSVKPLAAWLIDSAGWRVALAAIGSLPLIVGVTAVLWGFRAQNLAPVETTRDPARVEGLKVNEALRSRAFWIMACSFITLAFAIGAPMPNMENILRAAHIDAASIVTLTSWIGIATVLGRLIGGWLMDRVWSPLVGASVLVAGAFSCWLLSQPTVDYNEALIAIALLGFASGVEVDLLSYLVARYIGVRSYGVVYGVLFGLFGLGAGFGPALLGLIYDRAGSYSQGLWLCVGLLIFASGLLLSLGRYPEQAPAHGTVDPSTANGGAHA